MTDTRMTRQEAVGEQRHTPKHARRPESDFRWPGLSGAPDVPPPTHPSGPPPP